MAAGSDSEQEAKEERRSRLGMCESDGALSCAAVARTLLHRLAHRSLMECVELCHRLLEHCCALVEMACVVAGQVAKLPLELAVEALALPESRGKHSHSTQPDLTCRRAARPCTLIRPTVCKRGEDVFKRSGCGAPLA